MYPDNLWGVPFDEAEQAINACDCVSGDSKSLFDLLLFEGLIAQDVIENKTEVIRFTYERFSDYAIANHILNECNNEEDICKLFAEGGVIFQLLENKYNNTGIIEALGIEIPERFHKEFAEFVEKEDGNEWKYNWYLETTFKVGILSRTANSITSKSLDLLNQLNGYPYHLSAMDILVSLSTEPDHPWNANFLNNNLSGKTLAERDLFWSTYVAVNDYYEDEDQPESPIRTLLNWVLDTEMDRVDQERLRLTAVILLWLTTTCNRKVRQQATKALSKVLYFIPQKIKLL